MMIPNGHTKILGLIGSSIERSTALHMLLPYILSVSMQCTCHFQGSDSSRKVVPNLDVVQVQMFMPYKELSSSAYGYLDQERAERIGAINTVHKKMVNSSEITQTQLVICCSGKCSVEKIVARYILLVAGGAAKYLYALDSVGWSVHVRNRNPKRIQSLTGLGLHIQVWDGLEPLAAQAIVIQCTPLGQQGEDP